MRIIADLTINVKRDLMVNDDTGRDSDLTAPPDRVILGLEDDMTMNDHNVDSPQWEKWTDEQRAHFNGVYEDIIRVNSRLFLHPITIQRKLSDEEFMTIAWNAAWTAACVLAGERTDEVVTVLDDNIISVDRVA